MTLETYFKNHYTQQTAKAYTREIQMYLLHNPNAESALHKDIVAYLGTLRKRYHNPKTLSRILSSIKAWYDYLCFSGKRNDNPAKSIRLRDKQNRDIQLQDLFSVRRTGKPFTEGRKI